LRVFLARRSYDALLKKIDWNIEIRYLIAACKNRGKLMENNGGAKFLHFLTGVSIGALVGVLFALRSGTGEALLMEEALEEWEDEGGAARSIRLRK
jgi:hypothetical protein